MPTLGSKTLTPAARAALINIGTRRQGATVAPIVTADVLTELQAAGLVGKLGGLTRAGSIRREALMADLLDQML